MRTTRTLITAVCLLSLIVQPVVAAFAPCCCTQPAKSQSDCCPLESKRGLRPSDAPGNDTPSAAKSAKPSCCAKKTPTRRVVLEPGCCCYQSAPATAPSQERLSDESRRTAVETPHWCTEFLQFDRNEERFVERAGSPTSLSGPPLLALHCTWLK